MADNRIEYGIRKAYFAEMTRSTGEDGSPTYTYGTPFALAGIRKMTLDPEGDQTKIYADDSVWYTVNTNNGYSGELEFVKFSKELKEKIFKYAKASDGGLLERGDVQPAEGAFIFEVEGDDHCARKIFYDVTFGNPSTEHATKEDTVEATVVTIPFNAVPVAISTGELIISKSLEVGDTGYANAYTSVSAPTLATE